MQPLLPENTQFMIGSSGLVVIRQFHFYQVPVIPLPGAGADVFILPKELKVRVCTGFQRNQDNFIGASP